MARRVAPSRPVTPPAPASSPAQSSASSSSASTSSPPPASSSWRNTGPPLTAADDTRTLLTLLEQRVDGSKLQKARTMLKGDRFQLFSDVGDDEFVGVVKSQTDHELFYACRLSKDGDYCCCTQNLNACGGLRGSLCKHLLVMIVGLTRTGALDARRAGAWAIASTTKKPTLDKEKLGAVFLRYKGAEAGEVDWRPTETLPEDFYAF